MYQIVHWKNWRHHIHLPGHAALIKVEHFFLDKRFWTTLGLLALIAFILLMLYLGVRYGAPNRTQGRFYPGPYPIPM